MFVESCLFHSMSPRRKACRTRTSIQFTLDPRSSCVTNRSYSIAHTAAIVYLQCNVVTTVEDTSFILRDTSRCISSYSSGCHMRFQTYRENAGYNENLFSECRVLCLQSGGCSEGIIRRRQQQTPANRAVPSSASMELAAPMDDC